MLYDWTWNACCLLGTGAWVTTETARVSAVALKASVEKEVWEGGCCEGNERHRNSNISVNLRTKITLTLCTLNVESCRILLI